MTKILFIVPPKVHVLDLNGPAQIFYEANEINKSFDLHFISINNTKEIESSSGLHFSQLEPFENFNLSPSDFIFIPGAQFEIVSSSTFLNTFSPFLTWLKTQHFNKVNICSVCTGAFILGASGILNNVSCTTHWRYIEQLQQKYPLAKIESNRLFVTYNNLYTSAGVSSGIDLTLYILETIYGEQFALQIAKEIVFPLRRSGQDPQLNIYLQYRNHLNNRIHALQNHLLKNLEEPHTIDSLAYNFNMSPRNLTRIFKKETGITVGAYLENLRVEKAIALLKEGNKVLATTLACGLKSPNQLRNLLKKHKGILPSELN